MNDAKIGAYQQHIKSTETTQETEAAVLEKAAFYLESAQHSPADDELFAIALQFNQLVWTAIQSVLDDNSGLPKNIVANLMSLSIFIDRRLTQARIEENRDLLTSIISINRNIAAGLRDGARFAARQAATEGTSVNAPPPPPPDKMPPTEA